MQRFRVKPLHIRNHCELVKENEFDFLDHSLKMLLINANEPRIIAMYLNIQTQITIHSVMRTIAMYLNIQSQISIILIMSELIKEFFEKKNKNESLTLLSLPQLGHYHPRCNVMMESIS